MHGQNTALMMRYKIDRSKQKTHGGSCRLGGAWNQKVSANPSVSIILLQSRKSTLEGSEMDGGIA